MHLSALSILLLFQDTSAEDGIENTGRLLRVTTIEKLEEYTVPRDFDPSSVLVQIPVPEPSPPEPPGIFCLQIPKEPISAEWTLGSDVPSNKATPISQTVGSDAARQQNTPEHKVAAQGSMPLNNRSTSSTPTDKGGIPPSPGPMARGGPPPPPPPPLRGPVVKDGPPSVPMARGGPPPRPMVKNPHSLNPTDENGNLFEDIKRQGGKPKPRPKPKPDVATPSPAVNQGGNGVKIGGFDSNAINMIAQANQLPNPANQTNGDPNLGFEQAWSD